VLLMLWVYYSAQIFFFGAEFTRVHARAQKEGRVPTVSPSPPTEASRSVPA